MFIAYHSSISLLHRDEISEDGKMVEIILLLKEKGENPYQAVKHLFLDKNIPQKTKTIIYK